MTIKYTLHKATNKNYNERTTAKYTDFAELRAQLYNDCTMAQPYETPTSDLTRGKYKIIDLAIFFDDGDAGYYLEYENTIDGGSVNMYLLSGGATLRIAKYETTLQKFLNGISKLDEEKAQQIEMEARQ